MTISRRHLLLGGGALIAAGIGLPGCSRRGVESSASYQPPAPAPARAPAVPLSHGSWHEVARGDTLAALSRRSGVAVNEIRAANNLTTNLIKPGQRLWLPGCHGLSADPLAATTPSTPAPTISGGRYRLVPRREWTTAAVGKNHRKIGSVTRLTVHHTGEHKGFNGKSDVEIVKMIDRYHRRERKWSAIGYHYLVGKDGRIYEGRPASIQGAHVSGANANNIGISCIGDFHRKLPTAAQLGALATFLDDQRQRYGVARKRVYGHRDLGQSVCPGDKLHAWLVNWKRS
ncbi:MAG: N-acetylmuramoyl-L-alanine amidase [Planctomycetota bacterium]